MTITADRVRAGDYVAVNRVAKDKAEGDWVEAVKFPLELFGTTLAALFCAYVICAMSIGIFSLWVWT
jgi:hypothetical protein